MHQELGDRSGVALVTGNIGNVHYSTGNNPAALEHYHRALAMHEEQGDRSGVARVTGNIGTVHGSTGDYSAALEHYHRALALHEELGESDSVARITGNIIMAMIDSGKHAEAEALLQTMDGMQIDTPRDVVQREQNRASLQAHHGNIDEARATLRAALLIAQEHTLAREQAYVHRELRDLAQQQNDLAGYIEHNNEYTRITEEINGKDTATKLAMQEKQREIDAERKEIDKQLAVLHSTLPKHIADRVARGETVNDHHDDASVIFLDIVGFTSISDRIPSGHVVHLLEQIFTTLDAVCERHGVVKIKTIGDSYMAVSFDSVTNAATCALDMISSLDALEITMPPSLGDTSWTKDVGDIKVRVGLHYGPVTAGVIGTARMQYDVWGDTVNVASRMESSGEAGRIHVSEAFASRLRGNDGGVDPGLRQGDDGGVPPSPNLPVSLSLMSRGTLDIKGKGPMTTYWLEASSS
jgi:class 3 adenylate cyclase